MKKLGGDGKKYHRWKKSIKINATSIIQVGAEYDSMEQRHLHEVKPANP